MFSCICGIPSSLYQEAIATGYQMQHTANMRKHVYFSGFIGTYIAKKKKKPSICDIELQLHRSN